MMLKKFTIQVIPILNTTLIQVPLILMPLPQLKNEVARQVIALLATSSS